MAQLPIHGFSRAVAEPLPVWHCLRSRSRHGQILARELRSRGFEVFAPTKRGPVAYGRVVANVEAPVFGDLVFVFATVGQISADAEDGSRVLGVVRLCADDDRLELTIPRARRLLGMSEASIDAAH